MNIAILAGGVGGAKLVHGVALAHPGRSLTAIVNTGDDFVHYGLQICPDLDTVCYTLAGIANPVSGWGLEGESWAVLSELRRLGGPDWFQLGDRDLATHLERSRRLAEGESLSQVTRKLCERWGVHARVLPMTDMRVATKVQTRELGELSFQEYFVREACRPSVTGFCFEGIEAAQPAPGVMDALEQADLVVVGPSNPWVSIAPILELRGVRSLLARKKTVAVSPIIGGKALKGPAAKMYQELGHTPSAAAVAEQYRDFLTGFVYDHVDANLENRIAQWGIISLITDTIMLNLSDRERLAREVIAFSRTL